MIKDKNKFWKFFPKFNLNQLINMNFFNSYSCEKFNVLTLFFFFFNTGIIYQNNFIKSFSIFFFFFIKKYKRRSIEFSYRIYTCPIKTTEQEYQVLAKDVDRKILKYIRNNGFPNRF